MQRVSSSSVRVYRGVEKNAVVSCTRGSLFLPRWLASHFGWKSGDPIELCRDGSTASIRRASETHDGARRLSFVGATLISVPLDSSVIEWLGVGEGRRYDATLGNVAVSFKVDTWR